MNEKIFTSRRFHFVMDAFNCDKNLLSNKDFLKNLIQQIAEFLEIKIWEKKNITEGIRTTAGFSFFTIIDFSHISIHSFIKSKEIYLDIFSYKMFDYKKLEELIKTSLNLDEKQYYKSIVRYDQLNIERDKKNFLPQQYLADYYNELSKENVALLEWYNIIYSDIGEKDRLLEIGGGPTIYQLISASNKIKKITFTDYSQENLDEVMNWLKKRNTFWDKFIEYVLKIELGKRISKNEIDIRKKQIAKKITKFIQLDIGKKINIFVNKFNVVQSSFCLESSTDDISEFKRMLKNCFCYLKPNGYLFMVALEGAIVYKMGGGL